MTPILHIYFLFYLPSITIQNSCSWSSWSSKLQCEWVKHNCIQGYHRYCLCNNIVSRGSACYYDKKTLRNYIETKPFVSNFHYVKDVCYKHDCPKYTNWCDWESWSYWSPRTNTTCERRRVRKCCESQQKSGYTISLSRNYGCFVSTSEQNSTHYETESKEMQCSQYTQWYNIIIYVGVAVGCLMVLCIICRFTKSPFDKIRPRSPPEEISFEENINENVPTAPIDQPQFVQPIVNEVVREPFISTAGLPTTPPSYDETIGFNNFSEPIKYTTVPVTEKVNEDDSRTISRRSSTDDVTNRPNTENIPPPSYALYLRNPTLFSQNN